MHEETIDMTPAGMTTPEGQERVRVAMQKLDSATTNAANAARQFLSEYGGILDDVAEEDAVGRGDFKNDLESLRELFARQEREHDQLCRAVAGR